MLAAVTVAAPAAAQEPREPERLDGPAASGSACAAAAPDGACATDVSTYVGWRVYGEYCASCHSRDALGSDFAPSLLHRMRGYDRQRFFSMLDNGYVGGDSELGPWGRNPDVARYYDELWTYLNARAGGRLPPGPLLPRREPAAPAP